MYFNKWLERYYGINSWISDFEINELLDIDVMEEDEDD